MSRQHVIEASKNPAYRNTLSPAEREALPANPAGAIEISDESLRHLAGGIFNPPPPTALCVTEVGCTSLFCPITLRARALLHNDRLPNPQLLAF